MPHKSLTFNGIRKNWLYLLSGRSKSPFAPINNNLLHVPGMPGAHIISSDTDVLYINQPIGFVVKDDDHAQQILDELKRWLITDEPVELQFDDDPGRIYYAKVQGSMNDFEKFVDQRKGTIQFLCADPYNYGQEIPYTFPTNGVLDIENIGTAEANSIITLEVLAPITFAMIQNQNNEYILIGKPVDVVTGSTFRKYERILYSDATSLNGWTDALSGEIDGTVAGTMETNGTRFQAANYGTGSSWHGPAKKHSLPEVLTDFRLEAFIAMFNAGATQVGRLELYLLDVNGNQVAKVATKDTRAGRALGWGEARAGNVDDNHYLINEPGDIDGNWNNFNGILRIEREGTKWRVYFAMVDTSTGIHHTRRASEWRDAEGLYSLNVAQVVVHMGQFGTNQPIAGGIYSLSVFKINQQPGAIPYIAEPEDILTIDTKKEEVLRNGEDITDQVDFGTDFFKLQPGPNQLVSLPSDQFNSSLRYRPPYK
ncbi:distal tail protein Dit [Virgibacillus ndiopensis]|uniref:distal tail protein Dit n=1 Tax=Virgibacillus ndiopensis TaxID=2004408 RepID=UPI00159BB1EE|nr:distal tail protein Dit [Virgibacillus ndiopensis]